MKKLFLSLMALAALAVGCQQDNPGLDYDGKDSVPYTISVAVPELAATRANETEMNSGLGAIDNFSADEWAAYDLRYILEVYDVDRSLDEPIKAREIKTVDEYSEITFETRLIPNRNYRFVVWADFVLNGTEADLHYNTGNYLTAITRNEVVAMDECQDAYFIQEDVRIDGTGISKSLELKRPFGKIRVITTDYNEVNFGSEPAWVNVTFYNHAIYQSLNAVTGEASGNTLESYTYSYDVSKRTPYTEGYDKYEENMTLFADYILAGNAGAQEVNFTIEVFGADQRPINSHDFNTQIPLERNYLTTIVGNLLTVQNDITVFVDDDFDGEYLRKYEDEAIALEEGAFNVGEINDNNNYTFVVNDGTYNFNIIVPQSAVGSNGELIAAEAEFVASQDLLDYNKFTVEGLKVDATRGAFVDAYIVGGSLNILDTTAGTEVILDLEYTLDYNVEVPVYQMIYFTYVGDVVAKTFLATPELKASVDGNTVTLSWGAVEGASSYAITCGTEMPVFVEDNTYTFTGEYDTEYRFHVVAMPENEDKHYASEPAELFITTSAPAQEITFVSHSIPYCAAGEIEYHFFTSDNGEYIFDFCTGTDENGNTLMVANTEENPYYRLVPEVYSGQKFDIFGGYSCYTKNYEKVDFSVAEIKVTELEKGNFKFEGQFKLDNGDPTTYTFVYTEPEPVEPEPRTITVQVDANMPELYFYSWNAYGEITASWPGDLMTPTGKPGEFAYTYAPEYDGQTVNLIFNNGQGGTGNQTEDIEGVVLNENKYFERYDIVVPGVTPDAPTTESVIYFTAPDWEVDGARFAVFYWNNSTSNFADLTLAEGEKHIYTVTIPAGYSNILFTRMDGANMENDWNNKWNQTVDLTIPTDGTNLFTITNDPWGSATGTWSVYTPSPVTPEENYITLTSMSTGTYSSSYGIYDFEFTAENGDKFTLGWGEKIAKATQIESKTYSLESTYSYVGSFDDKFGLKGKKGTFNGTYTNLSDGTIDVSSEGNIYTIVMNFTLPDGYSIAYKYVGEIGATVTPEPEPEVYTDFAETAEMTVVFGQTRYVSETYTLANNNWQENADEYNYGSYTTTQEGNVYKFSFTDEKNKRNVVITYTEETGGDTPADVTLKFTKDLTSVYGAGYESYCYYELTSGADVIGFWIFNNKSDKHYLYDGTYTNGTSYNHVAFNTSSGVFIEDITIDGQYISRTNNRGAQTSSSIVISNQGGHVVINLDYVDGGAGVKSRTYEFNGTIN